MDRLGTKGGQEALEKEIPLGRQGKVGDIASMAVFLFSEEAAWVSGQVFVSLESFAADAAGRPVLMRYHPHPVRLSMGVSPGR